MKNSINTNEKFTTFINEIKSRVYSSQIKAAVSVNVEMMKLYWFLGMQIVEKQKDSNWGSGLIKNVSKELQAEFPDQKGFSMRNLERMRKWVLFWELSLNTTQVVSQIEDNPFLQIPWGQNLVIISKCDSIDKALYYVKQTIQNNWSRAVLVHQIEGSLYEREGSVIHNFEMHLPKIESDLAKQTLKDPYSFDFLSIRKKYDEKELEDALVSNITEFLLELGAGFSYVGKQYKLVVEDDEFYIDLLFYHIKLHRYVVIELKTGKFKPEYAGKLNFYVTAVDEILKGEHDNPTIGLLICKTKKKTIVEYSLKDLTKPIGVSEYELTQFLPEEYKSSLPTIDDIESELNKIEK